MVSNKDVAKEIVKLLQGTDITKKTKIKIIKEINKRLNVGAVVVTDVLSKLEVLEVIYYQKVQNANLYSVNEKNLGGIEKIKD